MAMSGGHGRQRPNALEKVAQLQSVMGMVGHVKNVEIV